MRPAPSRFPELRMAVWNAAVAAHLATLAVLWCRLELERSAERRERARAWHMTKGAR